MCIFQRTKASLESRTIRGGSAVRLVAQRSFRRRPWRLAGSIADRQEIFRTLGHTFGDRLLKLHDLAASNWSNFASVLDLDASERFARNLFWSRLFDVEVDHFTDAALSDPAVLGKVRGWRALTDLEGRTVASDVAGQLRKLGFGRVRPITLASHFERMWDAAEAMIEFGQRSMRWSQSRATTDASRSSPPDRPPPSRPPRTCRRLPWCGRNCGCPGNDRHPSSC